ncbi:transposable element Tc1 transposase [Trichonephila clavipes]|uniref:Transposable element Tc1 transposase n=1 Tax=Trichonephila clavipes TaxID=2585209 RepID=A0A8X6S7Z2_TRICX|nr:transposable element Tc1 transposase [Trichonephila clavipes]
MEIENGVASSSSYLSKAQTSQSCIFVDSVLLSTASAGDSGTSRINHGYVEVLPGRMKHDFLFYHVDDRVRVSRLPNEQLFSSCTAGYIQGEEGGIMLSGVFSWVALGSLVMVKKTVKAAD